jgi:hypothetical protein
VGGNGIRALSGATAPMTMDEILGLLVARAVLEAEEAQRQLLAALNGLAGLALLEERSADAVGGRSGGGGGGGAGAAPGRRGGWRLRLRAGGRSSMGASRGVLCTGQAALPHLLPPPTSPPRWPCTARRCTWATTTPGRAAAPLAGARALGRAAGEQRCAPSRAP